MVPARLGEGAEDAALDRHLHVAGGRDERAARALTEELDPGGRLELLAIGTSIWPRPVVRREYDSESPNGLANSLSSRPCVASAVMRAAPAGTVPETDISQRSLVPREIVSMPP